MATIKNIAVTLFDAYFPFLSFFIKFKLWIPLLLILVAGVFGAIYSVWSLFAWALS